MTEEEKIYLYELNETYTDGFVRGYNRGFMDGVRMLAEIYADQKLMNKFGVEVGNDEKTKA